jgi:hypothetical protein
VPAASADALAGRVEPPGAVIVGPLFDGAAEEIEPAGVVIPLFDGATEGVGPGLGGGVVLFCALTRAGRNRATAKARENFMVGGRAGVREREPRPIIVRPAQLCTNTAQQHERGD